MADSVVTLSGWERALLAAEKVKERLKRSTAALERAGVPYAVAGGNAVAEWVGRVDEDAVRNTRDVDILIRRADLPAAKAALERYEQIGAGRLAELRADLARLQSARQDIQRLHDAVDPEVDNAAHLEIDEPQTEIMRGVMSFDGARSFECTDATTRSRRPSSEGF